ncbi:DUF2207 family protein [uncultured Microbacterium sp.]|uniref:DUF2207 family protein n=1 Tax=uncultured Microbacterium sp. TaxID=191216 RepID=UPI0025CD552B|nr:DUF2207 domain-containing protein [uncultured Microbacterium sp.]
MTARVRTRLLVLLGALLVVCAPVLVAAPAHADANDFTYDSWHVDYRLGHDPAGRATLAVTETLVAEFPADDQNHGIIRGLPTWYEGAPLGLRIVSVTDGSGGAIPFDDDETEDGERQVKIGDPDAFVHGRMTYVIRYTMRDVVHRPSDRQIDEWYWNLLPLNSRQPIARFTAALDLDARSTAALLGAPSCYLGPSGATTPCALTDAGDGRFTVAQDGIPAGSGVTVAFPMRAGTFAQAPARHPDPATDIAPYPLAGAGLVLAIGGPLLGLALLRRRGRRSGRGIVVAQYDVPPSLPPLLAAEVEGRSAVADSAEIVHLAVHGALRISDGEKKPVLQLLDPSIAPDPLDARALEALFPSTPVGAEIRLDVPDDALVGRLKALDGSARADALARDLLERRRSALALGLSAAGLVASLIGVVLAVPGLAVGRPAAIAAFVVAVVASVAALVAVLASLPRRAVLTPQGAETREYLLGVKEYIRLAEADRIRMLQSYRGAERRADGAVDVVVLYERLLPYAMLFGLEREWGGVLAVEYERADSVPSWYSGYVAGNLVGSLSGMGSSLSATPTASTSSSSSGSFGGGFSGGGGGGGSSGGW